jgi:hypothetical protein
MTEYPELQEAVEDLIEDKEVKAKHLGVPQKFEARTTEGNLSTGPTIYQNVSRNDLVAELIAQGTHTTVQHQQIDTLWRLYDQTQKEVSGCGQKLSISKTRLSAPLKSPSSIVVHKLTRI